MQGKSCVQDHKVIDIVGMKIKKLPDFGVTQSFIIVAVDIFNYKIYFTSLVISVNTLRKSPDALLP
jgi:hypothetical protein